MYAVGDRFEQNGVLYEVTAVINENNFSFRKAPPEPVFKPVVGPSSFTEEVKAKTRKTRKG